MQELTRNQKEYRLQVKVIEHLQSAFPQVIYVAPSNRVSGKTEQERKRDMHFRKMMGLRPGAADIFIFWHAEFIPHPDWCKMHYGLFPMQAAAIELKVDSDQSREQKTFEFSFTRIGGPYKKCKSVGQVHDTLKAWGIKPKHEAIIEPDLRSWDQKAQDGFEFWESA